MSVTKIDMFGPDDIRNSNGARSICNRIVNQLKDRLRTKEQHNRKLKNLLICNLDLIQQQNDLINKKEEQCQRLKQENESNKMKLNQRCDLNLPSTLSPPPSEMMLPQKPPAIFTVAKTEPVQINFKNSNAVSGDGKDVKSLLANKVNMPSDLDTKPKHLHTLSNDFKVIAGKPTLFVQEAKSESPFTVTASPGVTKILKNKKKIATSSVNFNIDNASKVKSPTLTKVVEEYDYFGIDKKNRALKLKSNTATTTCTVTSATSTMSMRPIVYKSVSETPQLNDISKRSGENSYQQYEEKLKEETPIPKIMLQKTNHGHMKILNQPTKTKTMIVQEPDQSIIKTETEIEWRISSHENTSLEPSTGSFLLDSMNEFSFCDSPSNVASNVLVDFNETQDLFTTDSALNLGDFNDANSFGATQSMAKEHTNNQGKPVMDYAVLPLKTLDDPITALDAQASKLCKEGRRKRKCSNFTHSKAGKAGKGHRAATKRTPKRKTAVTNKNKLYPGKTTKKPYSTSVGDPDVSWYFGLDTDVKIDDLNHSICQESVTVEVPKWREKIYTPIYTLEGTENLDDKVFEKRHQKYEAEERRQLRWHNRRVREQRVLEKLKQRQMGNSSTAVTVPNVYTVWQRPQRDIKFIEITDTLPVTAFGEPVPDLPSEDFMLPWVRTSDALKRSKRTKTFH